MKISARKPLGAANANDYRLLVQCAYMLCKYARHSIIVPCPTWHWVPWYYPHGNQPTSMITSIGQGTMVQMVHTQRKLPT